MKIKILFPVLFLLGLAQILAAQGPGFRIIVHADNPVSTLSRSHVSKLFLKKITRWENGQKVEPVDLVGTLPIRQQFCRVIHRKKLAAVKAYWQKQIFSGRAVPPPEKRSEKEVLRFVSENPGAIGYVSARTSLSGYHVKELKF